MPAVSIPAGYFYDLNQKLERDEEDDVAHQPSAKSSKQSSFTMWLAKHSS